MRVHTGEKPYRCTQDGCEKTFSHRASLDAHVLVHTGEKPFECPECHRSFRQRGPLNYHLRTHRGENTKMYQCEHDGCTLSFAQKAHRDSHMRTHTGIKAYKCAWTNCHKSFARKDTLTIHMRIHTDERPYVCTWGSCGRAFVTKSHLVTHIRVHTGQKPYKCDNNEHCSASFARKTDLNRHIKLMHTKEGMQRRKRKEDAVCKVLQESKLAMDRELQIDFKCLGGTFARIDAVLYFETHAVAQEVDEFQHGHIPLTCELKRMAECAAAMRIVDEKRNILFARYNPDAFRVDGVLQKVPTKVRIKRLLEFLRSYKPTKPLEIAYLFYDTIDGNPAIFQDPEYDANMKSLVTNVIVK
jgi:hypothetical protein